MSLKVPPLTYRLTKGTPLTAQEGDTNWHLLVDFANGLAALYELVFNPDGTLKNDVILTNAIKDRQVTQAKLDWLANFFATASGTDAYSATINPSANFTLGDGITTTFLCAVKFTNANTGVSTIDFNAFGAKPLRKWGGAELSAGAIKAGSIHLILWDGTQAQVVSETPRPHGIQIYTAGSGSFTVPSEVYELEVEVVGAGGGGGGNAGATGGGGGAYSYKKLIVTPAMAIPYVIGAAGVGSTGNNATDGADSTFNTTVIAGGGKNGDAGLGVGGVASGGDENIPGEDGFLNGQAHGASDKCEGGQSARGFGYGGYINPAAVTKQAKGYGAGGFGDTDAGGGFNGSNGTDGIVIIRW